MPAIFVRVFSVGTSAGAAAHAQGPEETGGERKGNGEPGSDKDVAAHGAFDAVRFQGGVEGASKNGKESGGGYGGGDGEEGGELVTNLLARSMRTFEGLSCLR